MKWTYEVTQNGGWLCKDGRHSIFFSYVYPFYEPDIVKEIIEKLNKQEKNNERDFYMQMSERLWQLGKRANGLIGRNDEAAEKEAKDVLRISNEYWELQDSVKSGMITAETAIGYLGKALSE